MFFLIQKNSEKVNRDAHDHSRHLALRERVAKCHIFKQMTNSEVPMPLMKPTNLYVIYYVLAYLYRSRKKN